MAPGIPCLCLGCGQLGVGRHDGLSARSDWEMTELRAAASLVQSDHFLELLVGVPEQVAAQRGHRGEVERDQRGQHDEQDAGQHPGAELSAAEPLEEGRVPPGLVTELGPPDRRGQPG